MFVKIINKKSKVYNHIFEVEWINDVRVEIVAEGKHTKELKHCVPSTFHIDDFIATTEPKFYSGQKVYNTVFDKIFTLKDKYDFDYDYWTIYEDNKTICETYFKEINEKELIEKESNTNLDWLIVADQCVCLKELVGVVIKHRKSTPYKDYKIILKNKQNEVLTEIKLPSIYELDETYNEIITQLDLK